MSGLARNDGGDPLGTPEAPELTAATLEALGSLLGVDPQAIGRAIRARSTQYPTVDEAIAEYLVSIEGVRAKTTGRSYRSGLNRFTDWLQVAGLDPQVTTTVALPKNVMERYYRALTTTYGRDRRATVLMYTNAARSFLRHVYGMGYGAPGTSFEEVVLRLRSLMGKYHYKVPRIDENFASVVDVADALPLPDHRHARLGLLRDRALLRVLFCTGARRAEVASLSRDDIKDGRDDQALILGKGGGERIIFFDEPTLAAIRVYLAERQDLYRPLFLRHGRGTDGGAGRDGEDWRLGVQGIWLIVKKYAALAGVRGTVHHARHVKASRLLNNGAGLHHVQAILGHLSPETTSRVYAAFNTHRLREVFDQFS